MIAAAPLNAEQSDSQYVLAGTVVNARTGEPIQRALVELTSFHAASLEGRRTDGVRAAQISTFTDAAGAFRFPSLAPGNYRLAARKPQFVEVADDSGEQSMITLDKSRESLRVRLAPLGVIAGKVVDQDGEPVRGVNIVAMTRTVQDGMRLNRFSRSVSTDDRGLYRLWNLTPGKYYVKAAGRTNSTSVITGGLGTTIATPEGFAPVYAGGAHSIENAEPIVIEPGSEAQADFKIAMEPAYNIRGTLTNFITDKTVTFELFSGNEEVSAGRSTLDGSTGRFEIHNVIPGAYTVRATQLGKSRGEAPVTVIGSDVTGVTLSLSSGVDVVMTLSGGARGKTVRVPNPDGGDYEIPTPDPGCQASLISTDLRSAQHYRANPPANPVFHDVLPGKYRLSLACFGGYIASVTSGATDLLANPIIMIQGGIVPPPIEISLKGGGGVLTLTVTLEHPPKQVWALVMPQSTGAGPQVQPAGGGGELQTVFMNLAPGDYTVYAFSTDEIEFRNPQFLQTLTGGASVKIEDGGQQQLTLKSLVR